MPPLPGRLVRPAVEILGAPPKPRHGRDRLLDTAIDLFYAQGFHSVGLDNILAEAGVTKTTFYKHFESKDDLVIAAIRRRDEWETKAWERAVNGRAGGRERARFVALFDVFDDWFNDPGFGGCIFINAAAEFPDPRDPVHQVAAEYKRRSRDGWRDLARRCGAADPDTFADQYTALVEGTLILRHVHGRNDAARMARPMVERLVEEQLPRAAPGGKTRAKDAKTPSPPGNAGKMKPPTGRRLAPMKTKLN
jgi:AcrR family transcriptional regulator